MFYSETLLQKSGPLARVWLSANLERKLSKNHILQSNVTDSVEAIIMPNQAPMALRLSSQLLLGVVRIYQRKTRYLLDDCNEAMMKIKMAFRSTGNNDMAANLQLPNRDALTLPDKITPYDNFELPPPPDANWLLSQMEDVGSVPIGRKGGRVSQTATTLQEDFNNSQYLTGLGGDEDMNAPYDNIDLELDFGLDEEEPEIGLREEPAAFEAEMDTEIEGPRKEGPEMASALDLFEGDDGVRIAGPDDDVVMPDVGDYPFPEGPSDLPELGPVDVGRGRSESPLSDIDDETAANLEAEYSMHPVNGIYEPEDEAEQTLVRRPAQRAKKQRILSPDEEIALSSNHIKQQQANRDNIIKEGGFLPRDPFLLALMDMQKSGGFVSSIMMEGRSSAWAPELRGMISLDAVRGMSELKRKRDSGIADVESDHGASKSPRLQLGEDTDMGFGAPGFGDDTAIGPEGETILDFPAEDEGEREHEERAGSAFNITLPPDVHPEASGPVSLGTKHAVHVLRDQFGADAADSPGKRLQRAVVFQDLLPVQQTTKADATKMFFECLVLATKDAIKVEQGSGLGDPIRIRAKRGLWGAWAEREAGGEMAQEEEEAEVETAPEPVAVAAPAVAVSA
ncbi:hypothetical protein FZEAL_10388 [Fusarium zealandicum]|uniref:Cohesin complex subunit SCC1 n=1 Tax=Fusarium zealandicum TaxID=1053134 RepID=A0A8H4U2J3_9HYPO|nr:hypothetical protein FZEAL_10388 [Fusarium zealandicum]